MKHVKGIIFDLYGTLYDVHTVAGLCDTHHPGRGLEISILWRQKQLEYTWLRSLMNKYVSFASRRTGAARTVRRLPEPASVPRSSNCTSRAQRAWDSLGHPLERLLAHYQLRRSQLRPDEGICPLDQCRERGDLQAARPRLRNGRTSHGLVEGRHLVRLVQCVGRYRSRLLWLPDLLGRPWNWYVRRNGPTTRLHSQRRRSDRSGIRRADCVTKDPRRITTEPGCALQCFVGRKNGLPSREPHDYSKGGLARHPK
jgi:hypothetical protein